MKQQIKIFGAALDPLNSPERLNLKLSYLDFIKKIRSQKNSDPYDAMKDYLRRELSSLDGNAWFGKMQIESWLTPRPKLTDAHLLNMETFTNFLHQNGCWDYALRIRDYVEEEIFPSKPVMIGVDHSLTGGVIMALSSHFKNLSLIILDAHFDVINYQNSSINHLRGISYSCSENSHFQKWDEIQFYECGNFISYLLDNKLIKPENIWILGVQDEISEALKIEYNDNKAEWAQIKEYKKWIKKGVHLITKTDLIRQNFHLDLSGPTYLSVDMDVGSLSSVFSARFMNCIGLTYDEFVKTLSNLSFLFRRSGIPLVGLDIMEMEIHFLEASHLFHYKDYSRELVKEIFQYFLSDLERDLGI